MKNYVGHELDYVFVTQDVAKYIKNFGAADFLAQLKDLFPEEYASLVAEIKPTNSPLGAFCDAIKEIK